MAYFLAKSEPSSYSLEDFEKDGVTWWDGVHNYQAINVIKSWQIGDLVFFYRSLKNPAIIGLGKVVSKPEKDLEDKQGISWKAKLEFVTKFEKEVSLKEIKENKEFENFALIRQSRLSVMACTKNFTNFVLSKNSLQK